MITRINLEENDDRIINIQVTDKNGRIYIINAEFLAHDFGDEADEVNLAIYKPTLVNGIVNKCNSIVITGKLLIESQTKFGEYRFDARNVWFEFHAIKGKEQVTND